MAGPAPESFVPDPNLKIWLNGELVSPAQARVGVGIRSYNGRVFERITHLKRLEESARAIRLKIPYGVSELSAAVDQTLEANGLLKPGVDAYIRPVVTRGNGALGISPMKTGQPQVVIIAASLLMYPPEMYERGMPTIISSVTRNHSNAMPPRIKSLNYLNNILAKLEAIDAGVGEAIMLNAQGCVAEATGDNIFIVRNGQLQTPPTSAGILEGITRNTVIRLAREAGIEVVEKDLERLDLYVADECFLTGTGAEIIPVTSIDKRPIGSGEVGPIARQMITTYRELVRSATDVRP